MAHFYGELQGNRGETTRCGTKDSGMYAHIRGWDIGVIVDIMHIEGKDVVKIYKTKGSNDPGQHKVIATLIEGE